MTIEDNLKSDDIEIVKLYTEILLRRGKTVKELNDIFKSDGVYKIIDGVLHKEVKTLLSPASGWRTFRVIYETYKLSYKSKSKTKTPMYNSFLIPKNARNYVNRRNVRK